MALLKIKIKDTGSIVSYWRIGKITIDYIKEVCHIRLFGYIDKDKRDTGLQPELNQHIEISTDVLSNSKDYRDDIYTEIKKMTEWSDSENI